MALTNIAKAPAPRVDKGPSCTVCQALEVMPKAEATALLDLLSNPAWSFKAIAEAIREDPDPHPDVPAWVREIGAQTLGRHATAGCNARLRLRPRK